jgi:hypothetical protein
MTDPDRSRVGSVNTPRATPGSNVGHGRKNPLEPGGLSVMTRRSTISRLAKTRGLMATLTNQAARIIRFDRGRRARIHALSARNKVYQTGSSSGSLSPENLSTTNLHSSDQIEQFRAATGSNFTPKSDNARRGNRACRQNTETSCRSAPCRRWSVSCHCHRAHDSRPPAHIRSRPRRKTGITLEDRVHGNISWKLEFEASVGCYTVKQRSRIRIAATR